MKFLGRTDFVAFLRQHPEQAETLRAWLGEIQHRHWCSREALAADFQSVDATRPPLAVFRVGRPALLIETLVDYRNGIVLLTGIRLATELEQLVN
jgi:mRNA-degrading endonuclease HigB of HigAB toxin-antitoxin module